MRKHQIRALPASRVGRCLLALATLGPPLALGLVHQSRAGLAQAEALVLVNPELSLVARGSHFTVDIDIRDAVNLGAFQFTLGFPTDLVSYDSVEIGPFLGSTGRQVITFPPVVQNGKVTFVAVSQRGAPGPSGAGTLATVRFEALGGGSGVLGLSEVLISDSENGNRNQPGVIDGRVVVDATPEATPTPRGFHVQLPLLLGGIEVAALPTPPTAPPPTTTPLPPTATATRTPTSTPTLTLTPAESPTPEATPTSTKPDPRIGDLQCNGTSDEVVSIINLGGEALDLDGWQMFSTQGIQTYRFEESYILEPGASVYLHSGYRAPETSGNHIRWSLNPIWNEVDGDTAQLRTPRPELRVVDSRDCPR